MIKGVTVSPLLNKRVKTGGDFIVKSKYIIPVFLARHNPVIPYAKRGKKEDYILKDKEVMTLENKFGR